MDSSPPPPAARHPQQPLLSATPLPGPCGADFVPMFGQAWTHGQTDGKPGPAPLIPQHSLHQVWDHTPQKQVQTGDQKCKSEPPPRPQRAALQVLEGSGGLQGLCSAGPLNQASSSAAGGAVPTWGLSGRGCHPELRGSGCSWGEGDRSRQLPVGNRNCQVLPACPPSRGHPETAGPTVLQPSPPPDDEDRGASPPSTGPL